MNFAALRTGPRNSRSWRKCRVVKASEEVGRACRAAGLPHALSPTGEIVSAVDAANAMQRSAIERWSVGLALCVVETSESVCLRNETSRPERART